MLPPCCCAPLPYHYFFFRRRAVAPAFPTRPPSPPLLCSPVAVVSCNFCAIRWRWHFSLGYAVALAPRSLPFSPANFVATLVIFPRPVRAQRLSLHAAPPLPPHWGFAPIPTLIWRWGRALQLQSTHTTTLALACRASFSPPDATWHVPADCASPGFPFGFGIRRPAIAASLGWCSPPFPSRPSSSLLRSCTGLPCTPFCPSPPVIGGRGWRLHPLCALR